MFVIGLCNTTLSADAAKDAWKRCSKATDGETRLQECSVAVKSGTLSNDIVANALLIRGSAYDERGDYDQAIKDLDESIRLNPYSSQSVDSRGWEYLRKFDYKQAIEDFDRAIYLEPKNPRPYANRGIAKFLLGDFSAAEEDFVQNEHLSPKGAARVYSGLERLLAHMRQTQGKTPGKDFKLGTNDLTRWPGPIMAFYEGFGTEEAVLHAADSGFPTEKKWKLCQAYFFLAEHALLDGDREKAMQFLQKSLATGATTHAQYAWAQGELHNLESIDHKGSALSESETNPNP
jgi:lipoprotein NlpI